MGRRFQKKLLPNTSCHYVRHFGGRFPKNGGLFSNVIRVIFENMREILVTLVSTYIIFREYFYSDSILLPASHNGGLNLAGCRGNLFSIILA